MAVFMVALFGTCVTSCSNDDDDSSDSLSGTWEARTTDENSVGTWTFTFKKGIATYVEKWSEPGYEDDIEKYTGPYTIEEEVVTMDLKRTGSDDDGYVFVFMWEVKGKQLTLTPYNAQAKDYWYSPLVLNKK